MLPPGFRLGCFMLLGSVFAVAPILFSAVSVLWCGFAASLAAPSPHGLRILVFLLLAVTLPPLVGRCQQRWRFNSTHVTDWAQSTDRLIFIGLEVLSAAWKCLDPCVFLTCAVELLTARMFWFRPLDSGAHKKPDCSGKRGMVCFSPTPSKTGRTRLKDWRIKPRKITEYYAWHFTVV